MTLLLKISLQSQEMSTTAFPLDRQASLISTQTSPEETPQRVVSIYLFVVNSFLEFCIDIEMVND